MSTIVAIYSAQPKFPATDQQPTAVRYQIGALWVDAIGGQPTQAEVDAFGIPTAGEISAGDDIAITKLLSDPGIMRAVGTMLFQMNNRVRTLEGQGALTVAQFKTAFKALIR